MIKFNKKNMRLWSIMGINPSIWSIGFDEVASKKDNIAVLTLICLVFWTGKDVCINILYFL